MQTLGRLRSATRSDAGASLVETLVALAILSIAAVAILAGLQLSVTASDIHRKQTSDGAHVRGYAEAIQKHLDTSSNYLPCAGADAYTPATVDYPVPAGHTAHQAAAVPLAGDGSPSSCPGGDHGVQRLRLTISSNDGRAAETLTLVVRRSCGEGTSCG